METKIFSRLVVRVQRNSTGLHRDSSISVSCLGRVKKMVDFDCRRSERWKEKYFNSKFIGREVAFCPARLLWRASAGVDVGCGTRTSAGQEYPAQKQTLRLNTPLAVVAKLSTERKTQTKGKIREDWNDRDTLQPWNDFGQPRGSDGKRSD